MKLRRALPLLGTLVAVSVSLAFALPVGQDKAPPREAFTGTYGIDSVHSTVIFRIKHLDTSYSYGRFNEVTGNFSYDVAKPENSKVTVEIAVETLDTGTDKRDAHLKSPDFFDAVQFPVATFTSKSVKKSGDKKLAVAGDLGLHGVKKPVTLEIEETGASDSQKTGVRVGFHGTMTLKRSDFGMNFMQGAVGDEVNLTVSIEAQKTDGAR